MDLTVPRSMCPIIGSELATLLAIAEMHSGIRLQDLTGVSYLLNTIVGMPSSVPKASEKAMSKRKAAHNDGHHKAVRLCLEAEEQSSSDEDVPLSQHITASSAPIQHSPTHDPDMRLLSEGETIGIGNAGVLTTGGERRYNTRWEMMKDSQEAPKPVHQLVIKLSLLRNEEAKHRLASLGQLLSSTQTSDAATPTLLELANKCISTEHHIAEHSYLHMHVLLQFVVWVDLCVF
jgi:hypothetical protein